MSEFLLEVRAEEIPARMLPGAIRELATRVFEELMARGLAPAELETGVTPRRLVLILKGLPARERDRVEEMFGPPFGAARKNGEWSAAAQGFAKKVGVDEIGGLSLFEGRPGKELRSQKPLASMDAEGLTAAANLPDRYLGFSRSVVGRSTGEVLAGLVPQILAALSWSKTMKWCTNDGPWVRPLHGIVALLDGEVVPFSLFGVHSGRSTIGHPILSPAAFEIATASEYRQKLAALGLEISFEERRKRLWQGVVERAARLGAVPVEDAELLDKLASICEIPGVMEGSLSDELLRLPREVLQTSLRDHQSAFTAERDGALAPVFLTVMDRPDDPKGRVRAGNEWVVAARLADAKFFYAEDRKTRLEERREKLGSLTFHDKLGSYAQKQARVGRLAERLALAVGRETLLDPVARASSLFKVDLTTEMVREFTSLQGVMGGVYAREDGETEAVWQAIYDQYQPASTSDALPRGEVGPILAIADRLDTLVGMFGLGLVPTGSKDPFGLRRAAQGLVRIALERRLDFDLEAETREAYRGYEQILGKEEKQVRETVVTFCLERLKYLLGTQGLAFDEIDAALGHRSVGAIHRPLFDYQDRAVAFQKLRGEPWLVTLQQAAKRIENITKDLPGGELVTPGSSGVPAEDALRDQALALQSLVKAAADRGAYVEALRGLEPLAPLLDQFFKDVLVMDPDPVVARRRQELLKAIEQTLFWRVGRLTALVL
jgi:glycyl-tRNA synthetase beta chain